MRSFPRAVVALVSCVSLAGLLSAQPVKPTAEEVARKIQQLGDNNFSVREAAQKYLWEAGKSAEQALRTALKSDDPEISRRAGEVLEKFKWGLYPDTPKNIVELIQKYRGADPNGRQAVVPDFLKLGAPGFAALLKIAAAEENENARQALYQQLAQSATDIVADLLIDGQHSAVEELLELSLVNESDQTIRNYVAFLLLSGRLDARVKALEGEKEPGKQKKAQEMLVYLHRARGDLASARAAAEKSGREFLIRSVLYEQSDWKALAKRPLPNDGRDLSDIEVLGFKLAYHRLAGNSDDLAKSVLELHKFADDRLEGERSYWLAAKALLVNERLAEAMALIAKDRDPTPAFELLVAQLKYREALELADKARGDDLTRLELRRARTLYQLGQKEEALQRFGKLSQQLKDKDNARVFLLLETLQKLGLHELAAEHAAPMLDSLGKDQTPRAVLAQLFPKQEDAAEVWWDFLRKKYAKETSSATLKRVRSILAAKPQAEQVKTLLTEAEKAFTDEPAASEPAAINRWMVLGESAQIIGLDEQAQRYFENAASADVPAPLQASASIRLADFLREKKILKLAAETYRRAWEKDRKQVEALYLQGWCLAQAGQDKEGKKLLELAHWLPLGDDMLRHHLADELSKRGLIEAARRQYDFILKTGDFESWYVDDALRHAAYDAAGRKDHLQSAVLFERFVLRCLHTSRSFVETSAYLIVPEMVHRNRARGLLAAGKLDEARKEVQVCQALMPGDVELPILLVPLLEKAGKKQEAEELFRGSATHFDKLCADYPQSAWGHNSYAWLAACCRRDLDKALVHSRKAVELAPKNAGYLDTLAEVHFQRGDQKKALELMKQCLELDPKNEYYQKQLRRMEMGDPRVDVPEVAN